HGGYANLENHGCFEKALLDPHRKLSWRCMVMPQSLFHCDVKNFADVGRGVLGCRGLHSDLELLLELFPLDQTTCSDGDKIFFIVVTQL
ncbi:hypothetical protein Tco_1425674, partial [Tanacetum coccineum]